MPAPLVPAYVNLRMFEDMPLGVQRLRDSALASTPNAEAFRCSMLLFCCAWHQVPAGSLPNDDRELARLAGFGRELRAWQRHRAATLRGWVECDDGRLYHPVVSEKALEAWASHLKHAWKTECARLKKAAQRLGFSTRFPKFDEWVERYQQSGSPHWDELLVPHVPDPVPRDNEECPDVVPRETASKGREGKGRDSSKASDTPSSAESSRRLASELARAATGIGFEACSAGAPEIRALAEAGVTADELRAAAVGMKPGKGLAYLAARAIGRRTDAADLVAGNGATAPPADPAARRQAEKLHRLADTRLKVDNDFRLGLISPEVRDQRLAELIAEAAQAGVS